MNEGFARSLVMSVAADTCLMFADRVFCRLRTHDQMQLS